MNKNETPIENDIIPTNLAIRAMRDSGYRNTAYALAELIDNAVQAKASTIEVICIEETVNSNGYNRRQIKEIAILDNGMGMDPTTLRIALQFGNGTHLSDRSGIGRFGMGLPNSSISQGRRLDVWSWRSGPDNAVHCYLDVEDIENCILKHVPQPTPNPVPEIWRNRGKNFDTSGTLVVWSNFDEQRLTWKSSKATLENTEKLVGRIYRKFINKGNIQILLRGLNGKDVIIEKPTRVNDPLYLMTPSSTSSPFDNQPMFQKYGEQDQEFQISFNGQNHKVTVRASWARVETLPVDGTDRGNKPYGKDAAKNIGLSIVRADRELVLDPSWAIGYDPTERWWGIEVDFPPELDEIFGVTNNKQAATNFSNMVNFDWKTEGEPGEEFLDFKRRLVDEGDPRASLIDIIEYVKDSLRNIRRALEDQTKGRRTSGRRHEDPNIEDRASTKFKERANSGHQVQADAELFDDKAKDALINDLVNKKYEELVAADIASAVKIRGRKVIFIEQASEMDAFFSVEPKPGVTEIILNSSHPAYQQLLKVLDVDTGSVSDRDLLDRISNASDTVKMLFAAWARLEVEDVPNRERLRRMRMDWGRMSRDFLTEEENG